MDGYMASVDEEDDDDVKEKEVATYRLPTNNVFSNEDATAALVLSRK